MSCSGVRDSSLPQQKSRVLTRVIYTVPPSSDMSDTPQVPPLW
jgi:hypothetical protein